MDSSISKDGNPLPATVEPAELTITISNAAEKLRREDLWEKYRFSFADHHWCLVLHCECGNLVAHVEKRDSLEFTNKRVFFGVGILNLKTYVLYRWQESKLACESRDRIAGPVWIGPSTSDLLRKRNTLFPGGVLGICFGMSEHPSSFGFLARYEKAGPNDSPPKPRPQFAPISVPIDKDRFSTASTSAAATQKGLDKREEDSLSLHIRALRALSKNLKDLYLKDKDHDVKIIIGDKTLIAHRAILKARSPVLSAMFSHDTSEAHTGEVRLEDCHADDFAVFLLFLYSGTAEGLTGENVISVYDIADKYDVPELVEACTQHMLSNLTVHTVSDVIGLALKHGDGKLLQEATDFFVKHAKDIFPTVEWQRFLADNPTQANELVIKSVSSMTS